MSYSQLLKDHIRNNDIESLGTLVYQTDNADFTDPIKEAIFQKKFEMVESMIGFIEEEKIKKIYEELTDVESAQKLIHICILNGIKIDEDTLLFIAFRSSDIKQVISAFKYFEECGIEINYIEKGLEYMKSALESGNIKIIKNIYKKILLNGSTSILTDLSQLVIPSLNSEKGFEWLSKICKFRGENIYSFINPRKILKQCCINDQVEIIKSIIENDFFKVDLHYKEELYFRIACENGSINVLKYIYNYCLKKEDRINIYACNNYGFEKACWNNNLEVVEWLDSIGFKLSFEDGDHSIFKNTFKNNNKEVAEWFTKRYPIYIIKDDKYSGTQKKFVIDEMNYLENLFKDNDREALKKYLRKRGVIQINRLKKTVDDESDNSESDDDEEPCCIICGDECDCFVNVCNPKFIHHIYCLECLSKNYKMNNKKECIICKKVYSDDDIKLVLVE